MDVIDLSVCKLVLRESFLCLVFVLFAFIYIPLDNVDCLSSLYIDITQASLQSSLPHK